MAMFWGVGTAHYSLKNFKREAVKILNRDVEEYSILELYENWEKFFEGESKNETTSFEEWLNEISKPEDDSKTNTPLTFY